jgi:cephalosporin-C deacetylase-like acetyl esterase
MKRQFAAFTTFFLLVFMTFAQEPSRSVFYNEGNNRTWISYQNNNQALYRIISNEAFSLLAERNEQVSRLQTETDWKKYQQELKMKFGASLAKFEKTPLNAKVTGKLERPGFTVEKIVFESHPGFYVTGSLFIPKKLKKPAPAVIYCSGHNESGFRSEVYQRVIMNLTDKGFVVFAFDPIGQGERLQYVDAQTGKSKAGGSTTEHSYAGAQTLLSGISLSDYFIWDGVRAVDFLETRKEVDSKRIGITGRSGGGTQSALIAAFDDRILAAAPECYITSFQRLLQSIGPQDAEQNPFHFIKNGMNHADFLHLRAPKPALIITTTHDFFSQQGARETFAEVQKSYAAFGVPDNIQFTVDEGKHESTKNNRETMNAFFQKYLGLPGDNTDHDITPFSVQELWSTPTGQVATSYNGETVFSLNQKYAKEQKADRNELKTKVAEIAGIELNRKFTTAVFTGKFSENGAEVKKYFLENSKNDYALPVFVISKPGMPAQKCLVWLPEEGKEQPLATPLFAGFVDAGYSIVMADLPGIGELFDPGFRGDGFVKKVPFNYTFGANLAGKSIPGIQAEALDLLMQFVEKEFSGQKPCVLAGGVTVSALLNYTALKNPFEKLVLMNPLTSYKSLAETEYYDPKLAYSVVPGSLPFYDFQDLVSLLPVGSVKVVNSMNALGNPIGETEDELAVLNFLTR